MSHGMLRTDLAFSSLSGVYQVSPFLVPERGLKGRGRAGMGADKNVELNKDQ